MQLIHVVNERYCPAFNSSYSLISKMAIRPRSYEHILFQESEIIALNLLDLLYGQILFYDRRKQSAFRARFFDFFESLYDF